MDTSEEVQTQTTSTASVQVSGSKLRIPDEARKNAPMSIAFRMLGVTGDQRLKSTREGGGSLSMLSDESRKLSVV